MSRAGERLIFHDVSHARQFPLEFTSRGPTGPGICDCGAVPERVVITTAGEGPEQLATWSAYPLAVDGWLCRCGKLTAPRFLEQAEATALVDAGVAHAREGRLDDAEYHFRRVTNAWWGYPLGHLNLASVYMGRERREAEGTKRHAVLVWLRDVARRHLATVVDGGSELPTAMVTDFARLLALGGDEPGALRLLDRATPELGESARKQAEQIREGRALFTLASELLQGRIRLHGMRATPLDATAREEVGRAIAWLEEALARNSNFATAWLLGKAYQTWGDLQRAIHNLEIAHHLTADGNVNGGRELVAALLDAGRARDALPVAREIAERKPNDAGLVCNLALVLLLAGDLQGARVTVARACAMDATDRINMSVRDLVEAIAAGRRPYPRTLAELERR
jgi:Flp pilus assembly protein TadD